MRMGMLTDILSGVPKHSNSVIAREFGSFERFVVMEALKPEAR